MLFHAPAACCGARAQALTKMVLYLLVKITTCTEVLAITVSHHHNKERESIITINHYIYSI
jgi:hypothetical protein